MRASRDIRQGRIVLAWIADKNGFEKLRPAVLLGDERELAKEPLVVAAVTSTYSEPPPANIVPLPWHPREHPVTKLNRRSGAVCDWLVKLRLDDIEGYGGDVPPKQLRDIIVRAFPNAASQRVIDR